jgi:mono/diheme cytochrome c family protein
MVAMLARWTLLAMAVAAGVAAAPREERDAADGAALALLQQHCIECHGKTEPEGELELIGFLDGTRPLEDVATWRRVRNELRAGRMPPKKRARPPRADVDAALHWIDAQIAEHSGPIDPGRVTLRRLNAREYANTVRDLVGIEFDAARFFPTDDVGHGFDDIGDVLSMPAILFEKYADAAERISHAAIVAPGAEFPRIQRVRENLAGSEGIVFRDGAWSLHRNGEVSAEFEFSIAGEYVLRARAWAQQAGPDLARAEFRLERKKVERFDVLATADAPQIYERHIRVEAGPQRFSIAFGNDFYDPNNADPNQRDRNLYVEWLEVEGPVAGLASPAFQRRFLRDDRSPRELVADLAGQAWRRPAAADDVERLVALSEPGAPREVVVRNALEALLVSPRFLFLVEPDPAEARSGSVRDLDGFELATRMSYFLWSSLPDEELYACARAGRLAGDDRELERQARRMLHDARARALTDGFASQWLQLGSLERASPDLKRFEEFDEELRAAMRAETEMLFEATLRENRPVRDLLDPDFTFVNARLAKHYGIPGIDSPLMQRVRLDANARETRGGLLAQASVLTVTSNPTRTSPVKRGRWILDNVLGTPPPPPLPGVDSLDESPKAAGRASFRERLAEHRAKSECAVCHERMDQLGFALEGYDPIGRERRTADGFPIDTAGELDGEVFADVGDLKRLLAARRDFVRALAYKLATYALGRGLREADEPAVDALVEDLPAEPTLEDLILGVLRLDAFRRRVVAG